MQESVLLVFLQRQALDHFEEVRGLEVREESIQQSGLVEHVHIVDPYQVFEDFVSTCLEHVGCQQLDE